MTQLVDKYKLDPIAAKAVIEGVASRAYSLLLGAGASYGVEGGDGKPVKGAVELALEVNATLALGLEPPDSENLGLTAVRLKVEQIQLLSAVGWIRLGEIGLQGA